jgi:hypothetical protein
MDRKRFFLKDRSNRFDKLLVVPRDRPNDKRPNKALLFGSFIFGHKRETILIAKRVRTQPKEWTQTHDLDNWYHHLILKSS